MPDDYPDLNDPALRWMFDQAGVNPRDRKELRRLSRVLVFADGLLEASEEKAEQARKDGIERPGKVRMALFQQVMAFLGAVAVAFALIKLGLK